MDIAKYLFLLNKKEVFDTSKTLYQHKISLFLFAAIVIRLYIAFAVSKSLQLNQWLRKIIYKEADQVFHYLLRMQDYCICYKGEI